MDQYDYIIIGSGIAGLYTALQASEKGSVLVITKGGIDDCNTKHAQGGISPPAPRSTVRPTRAQVFHLSITNPTRTKQ